MNPLCPNCQTELHDDFGLVDCKSCGAVCSVDLDDNVTIKGEEEPNPLEAAPEIEEVYESVEETEERLDEAVEEEILEVEPEEEEESPVYEAAIEGDPADEEDLVETSEELESEEEIEQEAFQEEADFAPSAPVVASVMSGEDFLKDLEVFSDGASSDGGHVYYDLHVLGLEGATLRENFIETLADSRLEISEEAVREILGDELHFTLPQMSFLRLTVIYKRLLSLGLDMSWSLSEIQEPVSYMAGEALESEDYIEGYEGEEEVVEYEEAEEY